MNKPILVERYADNGAFSHWALIHAESGELLWSEAPEEEPQHVKGTYFQINGDSPSTHPGDVTIIR